MNKQNELPTPTTSMVCLSRLTIEPAVQAREDHLHAETLRRYIAVLKARDRDDRDHPFPPVKVCEWNDQLILVDGFHRVAAYEAAEWEEVPAEIITVESVEDLKWIASEANLSHGRALTGKEIREAFKRFVKARKHLQADPSASPSVVRQRHNPTVMTLGEIGKVFGKTKMTIRNWFRSDFRREFNRLYAKESEMEDAGGALGGPPASPPTMIELVNMSLGNVVSQVDKLSASDLVEVLGAFRIAAEQITEAVGAESVESGLSAWQAEGWEAPSGWEARPDLSDF